MNLSEQIAARPASYSPDNLLDSVAATLGLKNDAALARALGVGAPVISKIRHGHTPISSALLIAMHEVTGLSIRTLRDLMGDRRAKYRYGGGVDQVMSPESRRAKLEGGE